MRARDETILTRSGAFGAFTLQTRNGARTAASRYVVVRGAIAIVILAIANLGRRLDDLAANRPATNAIRRSFGTNAQFAGDRTRLPAPRIAVVDDVVAIVIDTITRFGNGR